MRVCVSRAAAAASDEQRRKNSPLSVVDDYLDLRDNVIESRSRRRRGRTNSLTEQLTTFRPFVCRLECRRERREEREGDGHDREHPSFPNRSLPTENEVLFSVNSRGGQFNRGVCLQMLLLLRSGCKRYGTLHSGQLSLNRFLTSSDRNSILFAFSICTPASTAPRCNQYISPLGRDFMC